MNGSIETMFQTIKRWSNLIMLPGGVVLLLLSFYIHSGMCFLVGSLLVALWLVVCFMWIVPTGNVGFIRILGKLRTKSYGDGPRFRIPVITETFLLNVMVQTKDIKDTRKVLDRNDLDTDGTLTFQLVEKYAHIVFKMMGAEYYTTHVAKWVDATIDTAVSKLTYPHFQALKQDVETWISKLVVYELAKKSSDMTEEIISDTFVCTACELVPARDEDGHFIKDIINIGDGETEEVQRMELREEIITLPGVNLFQNVSFQLNRVKFKDSYEAARANVAVRRAEVVETKLLAEKAREAAKGRRDAKIINAEGSAKETEMNMEAEGQGLRKYPEIIKGRVANNIPLVYGGGAMPMIDPKLIADTLEKRVGGDKTIVTPDDK